MIVPSIDLMAGHAVQLIGGKEKALDAGDPAPIAERFRVAGEIAVIDLDAALGQGSNESTIKDLLRVARCRIGGGIRDVETAVKWLDAGASKIILGTKAVPEVLSKLPRDRVIAALDAVHGEVVVEGWQTPTGQNILDRMKELRSLVGGFLVTFVEREGRLGGTNLDQVEELVSAAGDAHVTIAGGVTTTEDIALLDRLGADAQVGMALYTGKLHLADAITSSMSSERPDGLWPTVVCNEQGVALGLAWSSRESVREAVDTLSGVYHSRKRGLWRKGETSGATQDLLAIKLDCDRDALLFEVRQHGAGFCHQNTDTCWGNTSGLSRLWNTVLQRKSSAPQGSYTERLLKDSSLLQAKLCEEAEELAGADSPEEVIWEMADLLYFALTKMASADVSFADVERELDRRSLKISRRPGNAKNSARDSEKI